MGATKIRKSQNVSQAGLLNSPGIIGEAYGNFVANADALAGAAEEFLFGPNEDYKLFGLTDPAEALPRIQKEVEERARNKELELKAKREDMLKQIDPLGTIARIGDLPAEDPGLSPADMLLGPQENPTQEAIRQVLPDNPDEVARARQLGAQSGLPPETVAEDPTAAELIVRENEIGEALKNAPATSILMSDPIFAGVAHDAVEALAEVETKFKEDTADKPGFWAGVIETQLPLLKKQVAGALGMVAEDPLMGAVLPGGITIEELRGEGLVPEAEANTALMEAAKAMALQAEQDILAARPDMDPNSAKAFAFDLTTNLVQMIPTLAATVATRSPIAGTATLFGQQYADKFAESRFIDGLSKEDAQADALFYALAEAIPEAMPLGSLFAKGGKFIGANILKTAGLEAGSEMITQILQDGYDVVNRDETMSWGEFARNVAYAGLMGAALGGGMYTATAPFIRDRKGQEARQAQEATQEAQALTKAVEATVATPVAQRAPEAAAAHLAGVLEETGREDIHLSVLGLDGVLGEEKVNEIFQAAGVSTETVAQERLLGGTLTLSAKDFATYLAPLPNANEVVLHVRKTLEDPTAAEAEAAKEDPVVETPTEPENAAVEGSPEASVEGSGEGTEAAAAPGAATAKPRPVGPSRWKPAPPFAENEAVELAEDQLGLQAVFQTAEEAGMTEAQYKTYLVAVAQAREAAIKRKREGELKQQEKELSVEWQSRREDVRARMAEHVSQHPIYQAIDGIQAQRLDRNAVAFIIGEEALENLPTQGKRAIFTSKGEQGGIDPEMWADLHGYDSAAQMLTQMLRTPPKDLAIDEATDIQMTRENGDLSKAMQEIRLALEALHNDNTAEVLALELHWLRKAKEERRLSVQLIAAEGKRRLGETLIRKAHPTAFFGNMKRAGRQAGKLLRKGDREGAVKAKFQQVINFIMAREAYKVQARIAKQEKKLRKWANPNNTRQLPSVYQEGLAGLFANNRLDKDITPAPLTSMAKWSQNLRKNHGITIELPDSILGQTERRWTTGMTVNQWEDLFTAARKIYSAGVNENRLFRQRQNETRASAAQEIADVALANLASKPLEHVREKYLGLRQAGRALKTLFVNEDTVFSAIDKGLLGTTYRHIKGRIDDAVNKGYLPGQKGLNRRRHEEMKKYQALFKDYSKKERYDFGHKLLTIPGVATKMSRETAVSIVLNSGNASNKQALIDSGWTEADITAVRNFLDKKDLDLAQGIIDWLDAFWPDIKAAQDRRHDPLGNKIEAVGFDTPHGHYRGGYYPLEYMRDRSVEFDQEQIHELVQKGLTPGAYTRQYTDRGHTEARQGSGGRPIRLNLSVAQRAGDRVIYDLEMGDAVSDAYRVWNHKTTQEAFKATGNNWLHEHINLFLENMITGELHMPDALNRLARFSKAGLTMGSLGYNLTTALMQPLGLFNSIAQVGYPNAIRGLMAFTTANPVQVVRWINEDPVMQQREHSYNEAVTDAIRVLTDKGVFSRLTPGNSAETLIRLGFLPMQTLQRLADHLTYMMGYAQGARKFPGDEAKARKWAAKMVVRTQGSGNYNERTPLERGTLSKKMQNQDWVRALNPMISYFAAKYSIAVEKVTNTKPTPLGIAETAASLTTMIAFEAVASVLVRQMLDDLWGNLWGANEEEDDSEEAIAKRQAALAEEIGKGIVGNVVAGIPLARDVFATAQGFSAGGAVGSLVTDVGRAWTQVKQGEIDKSLWNSMMNLLGYFGLPKSLTKKYLPQVYRDVRGEVAEEDLSWFDHLMDVEGR